MIEMYTLTCNILTRDYTPVITLIDL